MKLHCVAVACAVLLGAGGARTEAAKPLNSDPDWAKKPTPEDLIAVWPKAAMAKGQGGKAVIHCKVSRHGALYDCSVVSESPAGAGFGGAGLALTPQFLMRPAIRNGEPVDGAQVSIPLNFPKFTPSPQQDDFGSTTVLTIGRWTQAPTYGEVAAAYPEKARAKGVGGHVALNCTLKADGHLQYCNTISAQPTGQGFEAASKVLSARFVAPLTLQGKTVKGMITQIAFTFSPTMLSDASPDIGKPHWTSLPTGEQMLSVFPALRKDSKVVTVRVRLNCLVVAGGKVDDCRILSEAPTGEGFGTAAVAASKFFEVSTWGPDGLPTIGGRLEIPIRYELGDPPEPAAKP